MLKKYWWVFALLVIAVFAFARYNQAQQCRMVSKPEWDRLKKDLFNQSGDWEQAHMQMLANGYCEQLE